MLPPYTIAQLQLCISTMDREDVDFIGNIVGLPLENCPYTILVINQSKKTTCVSDYENITVVNDLNYGLSRSRNLALEHSTASIVWILDDDVVINKNTIDIILTDHNNQSKAGLIYYDYTSDKNFIKDTSHPLTAIKTEKQLAGLSSITMTLKRKILLENGIKFNQRFGLRSQFQVGEEFVLATDMLENKVPVYKSSLSVVYHKHISSGTDVTDHKVIYARGALAARSGMFTAVVKQYKYIWFLFSKGHERKLSKLWKCYLVYNYGINDYLIGFEGHRIGHPKV